MKASFDLLKATRKLILKNIDSLSLQEVNRIPSGFNNSIAWNVAHTMVTQQLLCYNLSGKDMLVSERFIEEYRKGTQADKPFKQEDWESCKQLLLSLAEELERDYYAEEFSQYTTYPTSYGYEIHSIEEAIQFNNLHEALHLGYIMSMKRIVLNSIQ